MAPRPVATVAVPGWLSPKLSRVQPHALGWVPLGHEASLSLGQTTDVRFVVGLAMKGTRNCQKLASPLS